MKKVIPGSWREFLIVVIAFATCTALALAILNLMKDTCP